LYLFKKGSGAKETAFSADNLLALMRSHCSIYRKKPKMPPKTMRLVKAMVVVLVFDFAALRGVLLLGSEWWWWWW